MKKKINKVLHFPHIHHFSPLSTEEEEDDQDQYEMESTSEKVNVEGARFATDEESHNALSNSKTNDTTGNETEKSSSYAQSTTGLDHKIETAKAERRLLFKLGKQDAFNRLRV